MENDGGNVAGTAVRDPPEGVVQCEGIPRKSWMPRCVALKNDAGVVVGKGICHNVDSALIIDSDNQPLGDDRVAVQIAESLSEHDVPSNWVFQLRAWHISRVFLNGASLYDHEQMHLFNVSSGASRRQSRLGHVLTRALEGEGTLTRFQRRRPYSLSNQQEMCRQCRLVAQRTACSPFSMTGLRL